MIYTSVCWIDGRPFKGTASKPLWAIDSEGRVFGMVHTMCARQVYAAESGTQEQARWMFYLYGKHTRRPARETHDSPRWWACILATAKDDEDRERLLEWWEHGKARGRTSDMSAEQIDAIREAWAQLLGEYKDWVLLVEQGHK